METDHCNNRKCCWQCGDVCAGECPRAADVTSDPLPEASESGESRQATAEDGTQCRAGKTYDLMVRLVRQTT